MTKGIARLSSISLLVAMLGLTATQAVGEPEPTTASYGAKMCALLFVPESERGSCKVACPHWCLGYMKFVIEDLQSNGCSVGASKAIDFAASLVEWEQGNPHIGDFPMSLAAYIANSHRYECPPSK